MGECTVELPHERNFFRSAGAAQNSFRILMGFEIRAPCRSALDHARSGRRIPSLAASSSLKGFCQIYQLSRIAFDSTGDRFIEIGTITKNFMYRRVP